MDTMKEVGEKAFLRGIISSLSASSTFVNGFGHDASIMDVGLEKNIAFKIDRASYPLTVTNGWSDHKAWGRLAVAANLSDLIAVGSTPKGFMVSIVVPGFYKASDVKDIILGCQESCETHQVAFLGGDTKEGPNPQVVGAAFGVINRDYSLGRQTASPGDQLVVAGCFGGFVGAYLQLQQSKSNIDHGGGLVELMANPTALVQEALAINSTRKAVAACDLSDGLADALEIFCGNSVGIVLDADSFPFHEYALQASDKLGIQRHKFAFGVGDWGIAYVIPQSNIDDFFAQVPLGLKITCIGTFTSSLERRIRLENGQEIPIPRILNEHFSSRLEDEGAYFRDFGFDR